jgi:hypothetical protein
MDHYFLIMEPWYEGLMLGHRGLASEQREVDAQDSHESGCSDESQTAGGLLTKALYNGLVTSPHTNRRCKEGQYGCPTTAQI